LENVLSNNTSSEKEIEKKMCDRCNENKDREKNEMFNTVLQMSKIMVYLNIKIIDINILCVCLYLSYIFLPLALYTHMKNLNIKIIDINILCVCLYLSYNFLPLALYTHMKNTHRSRM
jgi:hypothetical protein